MRVEIRYGAGSIPLEVPDRNLARFVSLADRPEPSESSRTLLDRALARLRARADFARAVTGRRVGLLLEDATREVPRDLVLPAVASALAPADRVVAFVCTGTHDPTSRDNRALARALERALGDSALRGRFEVVLHDSRDPSLPEVGRTGRGHRVLSNGRCAEIDSFFAVSDMKNHYFAGYSCPVKNFVPGIAGFETVRANHALALDPRSTFGLHPLHPDPARRGNPLAEDLLEAVRALLGGRPAFALALFTRGERVLWAGAGTFEEATREGIEAVDREASVEVEPAPFLVVSPGGFPHDESLYAAQRALELTKNAAAPGAEILFLAECRNGVGPPESMENFYEALARPLPEVLSGGKRGYRMYAHKAYKFAELLTSVAAVHAHTALPAEAVERIHLRAAPRPERVIENFLARRPDGRILAFDDASKFAVRAASPASVA